MEIKSLYWATSPSMEETREKLYKYTQSDLIDLIINTQYNNFLLSFANYKDNESPIDPTISNGKFYDKRVPYLGWGWINSLFFPIGIN